VLQSGEEESQKQDNLLIQLLSQRQYEKSIGRLQLTCIMHPKGILRGTEENSHSVGHDTRFMKSRLNGRRTGIINGLVKHAGL
jgi:hypothetical protein